MESLQKEQLLIRLNNVCRMLDLSRNGLKLLQQKDPAFPKPIKFGSTRQAVVYFDAAEIRAWIEKRKAEARA